LFRLSPGECAENRREEVDPSGAGACDPVSRRNIDPLAFFLLYGRYPFTVAVEFPRRNDLEFALTG